MVNHERWKEHVIVLPPLSVGNHVRIQNQVSNHSKNGLIKTGIVIEVHHKGRQFRQDQYHKLQNFYENTLTCINLI